MRTRWREKSIPLGLAAAAYVLALVQRPGLASSDTKIDLHVDPSGFLGRVADVWSPTAGLGHVQGGQYSGYLWPMGPFFAALHAIGLSPWLVQRLWLGTLLALTAWGTVRLMDALLGRPRGVAHAVAAAVFVLNPYVVVFASRTTFTLIGYAALPWLLLATHRGLRDPRRLWWAAAFALIITSTGGGVNAAVTGWLLVAPLVLVLYEPLVAGVPWRDAGAFAWRAVAATAAASIWWVVPELVQSRYGLNFLRFTEQVGSIWDPTSLTESLRLMGYWPSYLGVGYGDVLKPYFGDSGTLLFDLPVVLATLLVPGLAIAGFVWTRRWRYGPFFLSLALVGLLIMTVGFPNGTPLRLGATFAYDHVQAIQFLRTTYKAGPLVALGIACLAGAAAAQLWAIVARAGARVASRRPAGLLRRGRWAIALLGATLLVLAAWPLFQGRAVELTWKRIPAAWKGAARDLDRTLPPNSRALVLPGQPFAFYRWGGTVDPILPTLTDRPVAIRNVPPYDDIHAVDLLWTLDDLVDQQRLLPGELPPFLDLMATRAVITGTDDDTGRSGGPPPADAARELAAQPGFARPAREYGPRALFRSPPETIDPAVLLPEVRRYDEPARGMVRVEPATPANVVDGAASGVGELASLGALEGGRALLYAGDLPAPAIRAQAAAGATVAITDSNRRRSFIASRPRQAVGWTLPASETFSSDAAVLDPFPSRGSDAQTVAVFRGARYVKAPYSPQIAQFPEHRPYAAFDGDPRTSWLADPTLDEPRHWVEVGLPRARDVPYVDVLPDDSNPRVAVTRVSVNGHSFALRPGWNRLPVRLRGVDHVRAAITGQRTSGSNAGTAGGFREVRVPGLRVRELLRPPALAERALAGADLGHTPLAYLFERTTADDPFRRSPLPPQGAVSGNRAEAEAALIRTAQDPEAGLDRTFSPPAARRWSADGWSTVAPAAADPAVDALAGTRTGGARIESSGRFEGRPGFRGSSAFDGSPASAWVAPSEPGRPAWLAWQTPRAVTLRALTIERASVRARFPVRVALEFPGGRTPPLAVGPGGLVTLPRPVRARSFRLDVIAASGTAAPAVASGAAPPAAATGSAPPAVAIGELRGPGLPRAVAPAPGRAVRSNCGALTATFGGGASLPLTVSGSAGALDAGAPLRTRSCGPPVALPSRPVDLHVAPTALRPLVLELRSPAPSPLVRAASGGGRVVSPGHMGRTRWSGVRVDVRGPSWLVLGESYSRGWRASCDGRSLGRPRVVDGFANGWPVGPSCHRVAFHFAPQTAVNIGYIAGAAACALLLLLLLTRRPPPSARRPPPPAPCPLPSVPADDGKRPMPIRNAALAGAIAGAVFAFVFALRAGVVIGPAVALILWRGFGPRTLILAAGALLTLAVPLLYILFPGDDRGGYDTNYATEHLGAHWVAVAAVVLIVLALWRTFASTATRPSGDRAGERAAEGAGRSRA